MRLFVALELSEALRNGLIAVQTEWKRRGVEGSFTPPENLHLTLAFIGEYPRPEDVLDALGGLRFSPFPLRLEGFGSFGDLLWCGVSGGVALERLAGGVRRSLAEAGIPFDRKSFRPHITLLRRAVLPRGKIPGTAVPAAEMEVDSVSLMRSERGKHGMIYTALGAVNGEGA